LIVYESTGAVGRGGGRTVASDTGSPRRVLVVDDDPGVLGFIRWLLEREGFLVDTAVDGADALARAIASPPDLIILDIRSATYGRPRTACRRALLPAPG
jgi:CheY-like chemotaxis protein